MKAERRNGQRPIDRPRHVPGGEAGHSADDGPMQRREQRQREQEQMQEDMSVLVRECQRCRLRMSGPKSGHKDPALAIAVQLLYRLDSPETQGAGMGPHDGRRPLQDQKEWTKCSRKFMPKPRRVQKWEVADRQTQGNIDRERP